MMIEEILGIQQTYLLGLSLGGEIALDFTLEHPAMVDTLILVGSPISGYPHEVMFSQEQLQTLIQQRMPFEQAVQDRNIPRMVGCLMAHPTLVPSPDYPAAAQPPIGSGLAPDLPLHARNVGSGLAPDLPLHARNVGSGLACGC